MLFPALIHIIGAISLIKRAELLPGNDGGAIPDSLFVDGGLCLQQDLSGSPGRSACVMVLSSCMEDITSA